MTHDRSFPPNFIQNRSVRVFEGRKHLHGRQYRSIGTEGSLEDIIQLGGTSVVLQKSLEDLSNQILRIMNISTLEVLGKVLRDQMEIFTRESPYTHKTITLHKHGFKSGGFFPDLNDSDRTKT